MNQEWLKQRFDYHPEGYLVNRVGARAGQRVGHSDKEGYHRVSLNRRKYYAHRLIWIWHYGEPPKVLDHIDRDKANNRIENLRPCSDSQNAANAPAGMRNTSGYRGVYFDIDRGKWTARIRFTVDGVRHRHKIGRYDTAELAAIAYNIHLKHHFNEFALLNKVDTPLGRIFGMA